MAVWHDDIEKYLISPGDNLLNSGTYNRFLEKCADNLEYIYFGLFNLLSQIGADLNQPLAFKSHHYLRDGMNLKQAIQALDSALYHIHQIYRSSFNASKPISAGRIRLYEVSNCLIDLPLGLDIITKASCWQLRSGEILIGLDDQSNFGTEAALVYKGVSGTNLWERIVAKTDEFTRISCIWQITASDPDYGFIHACVWTGSTWEIYKTTPDDLVFQPTGDDFYNGSAIIAATSRVEDGLIWLLVGDVDDEDALWKGDGTSYSLVTTLLGYNLGNIFAGLASDWFGRLLVSFSTTSGSSYLCFYDPEDGWSRFSVPQFESSSVCRASIPRLLFLVTCKDGSANVYVSEQSEAEIMGNWYERFRFRCDRVYFIRQLFNTGVLIGYERDGKLNLKLLGVRILD